VDRRSERDAGRGAVRKSAEPSKLRDAKGMLFTPVFGSPADVAARLNESLAKVRTTHLVLGTNLPVSRRNAASDRWNSSPRSRASAEPI